MYALKDTSGMGFKGRNGVESGQQREHALMIGRIWGTPFRLESPYLTF
jgi:hypothetical protein